jgi:hypothetical protein
MINRIKKPAVFIFIGFLLPVFLLGEGPTIEELKRRVEVIGKLKFKEDIPVVYISKYRLKKYISDLFEQEYPEVLSSKESFYIYVMGFVDRRIDLKKVRKKILMNNVGGLYNEKTKELYALKEYRNINMINAMIIIHELRHSIQDQYYNLSLLLGELSDFDDRKLATLAAIEGDATFVMLQHDGFAPDIMASENSNALLSFSPLANSTVIFKSPDIVKHQLMMPYIQGLKFTSFVARKKKWKGVNRILSSPPLSSEQILHPEKYLKNELPVKVQIGFTPTGYTLYHSGVVGQYFINILLKLDNDYKNVAAGWGGDTFKIYAKGSSYFLVWESSWDKEKFGSRFYFDLKRFVEKRFDVNFRIGSAKGSPFIAGNSEKGFFFVRQFKNQVFYVRTNNRNDINDFINGGYYD